MQLQKYLGLGSTEVASLLCSCQADYLVDRSDFACLSTLLRLSNS